MEGDKLFEYSNTPMYNLILCVLYCIIYCNVYKCSVSLLVNKMI